MVVAAQRVNDDHAIEHLDFVGLIGYLGWHEGGNPFNKLKRSFDALQEMIALVDENPGWCAHLITDSTSFPIDQFAGGMSPLVTTRISRCLIEGFSIP